MSSQGRQRARPAPGGMPAKGLMLLGLMLAAAPGQAAPLEFRDRLVGRISSAAPSQVVGQPPGQECLTFTLEGVSQADPLAPGQPWFAVPPAHPARREIVAQLLMARAADLPVTVHTAALMACGYITVNYLVVG